MFADIAVSDSEFNDFVRSHLGRARVLSLKFEKSRREAVRHFINSDEYQAGGVEIPFPGCARISDRTTMRSLYDGVRDMIDLYASVKGATKHSPEACKVAVKSCLYMVRGVVLRPHLRELAFRNWVRALQGDQAHHDDFLGKVDEFFRDIRAEGMDIDGDGIAPGALQVIGYLLIPMGSGHYSRQVNQMITSWEN